MSAVPTLPESIERQAASPHFATGETNGGVNGDYTFRLEDTPVGHTRPLKVIIIGAGYSGIYLGIRIPEKLRNVDLVIYEKNEGMGGTWWENRYPGCACDIPSHSYQYSFEPKPDWSALYAPSAEIREYLIGAARKYGADRFVKLQHQVTECRWDDAEGKWHVKVRDLSSGTEKVDTADVLISARGFLNTFKWPQIDGLEDFEGETMHSAKWKEDYDFSHKRTGVIGIGSSAIQILPSLQRLPGAQLTSFSRSRTWISPPFSAEVFTDQFGIKGTDVPAELQERFRTDPAFLHEFRLAIETHGNAVHAGTIKGVPIQKAVQAAFADSMRERLASRPDIYDKLVPSFAPGCKRLTPGIGFLEALCAPNVQFVQDKIKHVEPKGVRTEDGKLHELDALVCATGFQTSVAPPFPIYGESGRALTDRWDRRPETYLGLSIDGFPNHWMMLGPNSGTGAGSLTIMIESAGDYIVKSIRKLQKENIKKMKAKSERVTDFMNYTDAYMAKTVFMDDCKSWYRMTMKKPVREANGKRREVETDVITGLWPGAPLHYIEAMKSPRWEDYEYEYLRDPVTGTSKYPLSWLGNGFSVPDWEKQNLAWYLEPQYMQKPVPGRPEDNDLYKIAWSH